MQDVTFGDVLGGAVGGIFTGADALVFVRSHTWDIHGKKPLKTRLGFRFSGPRREILE